MKTLIGIVGYSPVLECYPLGPKLMSAIKADLREVHSADVDNMTWSPIHIVQRFQDEEADRPDRLILIGLSACSRKPGTVTAFRWLGGQLPETVVQERVYEAVTGIVDIENTLMIGEYFGVWPRDLFTVEADIQADAFGRMVIADNEGWATDRGLRDHLGFSPDRLIRKITEIAGSLARFGEGSAVPLQSKSAGSLAPVESFIRNFAAGTRETDRAGDQT
jgi:hypothetical protein